jgi:hypothetical protein
MYVRRYVTMPCPTLALAPHSLPVDDVARVQVAERHEQLHEPAHDHVLTEVAVWVLTGGALRVRQQLHQAGWAPAATSTSHVGAPKHQLAGFVIQVYAIQVRAAEITPVKCLQGD